MESPQPTDEALLLAWRDRGDRAAFEALFRRYAPRLEGYFLRSLGRPQVAKDLTQQTFLHLHRARADFSAGRPVRPWIYTIAANVKRMYARTRGRRPEAPYDPEVHEQITPAGASTPEQRAVRRALAQLPDGQREVVLLHWYEGLTFPEVAAAVGASTSAVKVRAHRAYKRLRAVLDAE